MVYQQLQALIALLAAMAHSGATPPQNAQETLVASACQCASSSCTAATRLLKNQRYRCSYRFKDDPAICTEAQEQLDTQLSSMQTMCMSTANTTSVDPLVK